VVKALPCWARIVVDLSGVTGGFPVPAQSVPVTFASFEARGFFTDRGTEGMAAWWKMPSAPGKVSIRRSRSVMLPSTNVTRGWSKNLI
jgi:hypothetical protein